ncbi:MAG: hypothetical protein JNL50_05585 [Phycisphaerae bacterium]|nr:hypothetical protein [Phycisphaerae bacterium]
MPEKTCIICGKDCSGVARQKDAKGNYACQSCLDARQKARAARKNAPTSAAQPPVPNPAASAAPGDDENMSYSILGDLPEPCGSCGAPLAKGMVVCMSCGYNAETGVKHNTQVQVAPLRPARHVEAEDEDEDEDEDDGEPRRSIVIHGGWAAGALGVVMAILFFLAKSDGSDLMLGVYRLGVIGVSFLAAISSIVIPFQEDEAGWGIGMLLANGIAIARAFGFVGMGMGLGGLVAVGATLYYAFAISESRWLKGIVMLNFVCMFSLFAFAGR